MKYSVLYVDDEPSLLELGKRFLELSGEFSVDTRLSPIGALEAIRSRSYDAIISDYLMPDMDGIRFLKEVRAHYGDLPFILFSGRGREEIVIEAINNGVDFYLQKGGQQKALFSELAHKIKKAVERRQAEQTIDALINAPPDVSMLLDTSGKVLGLNKSASMRFRKTREDLIGTDGYSLLFHDPAGGTPEKILELAASKEPVIVTDSITGRLFETHMYPVTDQRGEVTAVAVYSRDVTESQAASKKLQDAYRQLSANDEELREQYEALKQGEEQIRESEEKYRLVVENSHDIIYIYRDNRFLYVNERATGLTGFSHDELMTMDLWELIHPEDRRRLQESAIRRLSGENLPVGFYAKVLRKDRSVRDAEFFVDRVIFQGEQAILGIARDITELKRVVEALRERERTLRSLSDNLPDGMVYQIHINPGGKRQFTYVSAGVEHIHGVTADAVIKDPFLLYNQLDPGGRESFIKAENTALEQRSTFSYRARIINTAGEVRWVLINSAFREVPDGGIICDGIELDITASQRAEEELKAAYEQLTAADDILKAQFNELKTGQEQLAENEEKYRTLVEHTDDGVFIAQDGKLVFSNNVLAELTGYTIEEITGQPFTFFVAPEDRDMVLSRHRERLLGMAGPETYEFNLLHKDGTTRVRVRIRVGIGKIRGVPATIGTLHNMTEERQREASLAESEEKFRSIVETSPDMIFELNSEGVFRYISPQIKEIMGYTPDEIIGRSITCMISDEAKSFFMKELGRLFSQGGTIPPFEVPSRHRDGREVILEIRPSLTGTDDKWQGFRGVAVDVTSRKQIEKALRESEELHRKMIAAIPDIVVRSDLGGNIVFINDKGVEMSGASDADELVGKSIFSFFTPESLQRAIENTKLMFERQLGPIEYEFVTGGGQHLTLEVNGDVLRTQEGTPYGLIYICRDITDRRRAESALRESEEKYRNIIENMQDVYYRAGHDGVLTMISPYGAKLAGYDSPEEITGKMSIRDFYADPAERDTFLAHLAKEKVVTGYPITLKNHQGKLYYVMASSRLLFDENGEVKGIEGILHDITPLRQTEKALRQANRQITLMTSITRHDIRNQLMALRGCLELSMDLLDDRQKLLEMIADEQHIAGVIEEQINFTTIFDSIGVKDPLWQDVGHLIKKSQELLSFGDIRLDTEIPGIEIFADPLVEKVFYNLFDNALRYGGESMTSIRVYTREGANGLTLTVEDDGIGIQARDKSRMFTRGFGKNTGLGLFLVREILSITGMTIHESGESGSGARFEIEIPKETYRFKGV